MSRCCRSSRWREGTEGGGEARGPSPSSTSSSRGARLQQPLQSRPGTRCFRTREFPGSPPLGLTLHLLPRPRPLTSSGGGGGRGAGAAATCARRRPLTGTRATPARLQGPQPSGAYAPARSPPRALGRFAVVWVCDRSVSLLPTQHGGGVRGGFPGAAQAEGA